MTNVDVFLSTQTTALLGDGKKLTGITVKDRTNDEERNIALDGVFVQIGLSPNSDASKTRWRLVLAMRLSLTQQIEPV